MKQLFTNNRSCWIVFAVFALLFFLKNLLFQWFAFYEWLPAGSHGFCAFMGFILPKIATALLWASPVFLFRDKRWMILIALIVDTWCIANYIYMRNNNFLLDSFAFNIAGNLNGYWWSVLVFINLAIDLTIYAISCVSFSVFHWIKRTDRSFASWSILLLASVALHYSGEAFYILSRPVDSRPHFQINICSREARERVYGIDYEYLVEQTSLLSMPLYLLPDHIEIRRHHVYDRPLTPADSQALTAHCHLTAPADSLSVVSDTPLILIIVESLENWVCRPDIMPHLSALTQLDHVLYADHVTTQIVGAPSADGQMIVNTGLLPLTEGYTCFRYPHHSFPALMHLAADSTVMLLPHDTTVWNQTMMSPAYGYDTTLICSDVDSLLFERLNDVQQSGIRHIQCITQSTHAPFVSCSLSSLSLPSDMPFFMSRFMRAFNVLDDGLGHFIDRIATDSLLRTYTIVITGDHHILYREIREQYADYSRDHGMDYRPDEAFLPLIIYSPQIEGNIHLTDTCYQMDIYPTVLSLIGGDNYYWQGFGINLLDSTATRTTTPAEALRLSDLAIRNNYFAMPQ